MEMKLRKPINEILKGKIEPYSFEVGILKDKNHRYPQGKKAFQKAQEKSVQKRSKSVLKPKLGTYAGGPVRRLGKKSPYSIGDVSRSVRENTGINYLTKPWKKQNDDTIKLLRGFWKLVFGEGKLRQKKRVENLVQAVVRNPILKKAYGRNKSATAKAKGFNRKFIDTAQLFKNITARVRINVVRGR